MRLSLLPSKTNGPISPANPNSEVQPGPPPNQMISGSVAG